MITVSIPEERIGILIGPRGKIKKLIEKRTGTKILIGEEIIIEGNPLEELKTAEIIRGIGRGFSPGRALNLLEEEKELDVIKIEATPNSLKRIKARIIGSGGKSRRNIEKITNTLISVYGKTVSIIGNHADVLLARKSIEMLIQGRKHGTVYRVLERK